MAKSVQLAEYLRNIRELLTMDVSKFGLMVERQVQFKVLPGVRGPRATLEPELWELLVLCLDGHETPAPELNDRTWERAVESTASQRKLSADEVAPYPRAAAAVLKALETLREVGVYPAPIV